MTGFAVVGHVEWVEFVAVDRVPPPGGIAHGTRLLEVPGGGGGVSAVQMAKLAGDATLFTALGNDDLGRRCEEDLIKLGVTVEVAWRDEPTRRAFTHVDADGERTITTVGRRLAPSGDDDLAWDLLDAARGVYVTATAGDALQKARRARTVVATSRITRELGGVALDALVGSARDPDERYEPGMISPEPAVVVRTEGTEGGSYTLADGTSGRYAAAEPPGPVVDTYGAGDSFAAALTYGLGAGMALDEALDLAARCGAWCATGRGPFEGQLTLE